MKALCRFNDAASLADHQQGRFGSVPAHYDITIGRDYVVVSMGIWETVLQILIRSDLGLPTWCPAALFEIVQQPIPDHWHFTLRDGAQHSGRDLWTRWVAQWGYEELIVQEDHSDSLIERHPDALAIFNLEVAHADAAEQDLATDH